MMALCVLRCLHPMAEAEAHREVEAHALGGLASHAIADEEGQIVVLRSGPGLDDRDDMVGRFLGRERTASRQQRAETMLSEFGAFGVGCFDEAIGIEKQAIARFKRKRNAGVGGEGEGSEDQAVLFDGEHLSGAQEKHGWVAGGSVSQACGINIEMKISRDDELVLLFAAESLVHPGEKRGGICGIYTLRGGGELDHGCDEGCGNSMA